MPACAGAVDACHVRPRSLDRNTRASTAPRESSSCMDAQSLPSRLRLTQPMTTTLQLLARAAWWSTNSTAPWLSIGGSVLGMQAIVVNPPASAAAQCEVQP